MEEMTVRLKVKHLRMPAMLTVRELRANGVEPSPKGGLTVVQIFREDTLIAQGEAWCSLKDNYSRRLGRTIATGRAVKRIGKEKVDG